ncbi:MAG: 3-hydroxyacyl-ACP dehydratase FabZ [Firmicutes bacterium]|nr:3-hydroxyacyl-ACP dehydratase FabZ [Bacillota bacterium]
MLDINAIKELLPHRFPFLLVDRVIEIESGKRAVAIKNITTNDYYSQQEYFNGEYVMPGALQVEAMAQVSAFVVMDLIEDKTQIPLFASIEKARFRKPALPGDQLRIEVILKRFKAKMGKFKATTYIGDEIASEAEITCMLVKMKQ